MDKVALYCRVSTKEQTTENQRIRLLEYAQKQGLEFELFEEVESTRKTRPVKAALLKRLRNKEFSAVVVWKLDRWARSSSELILEVTELVDKKIGFVSLSEQLDFGSATGKLMFHLLSAFADFERELIRERTLEGLNRAKSNGKQLGRPIGSKDKKTRRTSGYVLRHAQEKQSKDRLDGVTKNIGQYL